ncbi:unnamed protein product, partial [Mesorhabditis spiculigera]
MDSSEDEPFEEIGFEDVEAPWNAEPRIKMQVLYQIVGGEVTSNRGILDDLCTQIGLRPIELKPFSAKLCRFENTEPAIGIDLGTTCSVFAVCIGGEAVILPNEYGNRTTPSQVAFVDGRTLKLSPMELLYRQQSSEELYAGERAQYQHNTLLGKFTLPIRKAPAWKVKVRVTLEVDCDGIMTLTAEDLCTGTSDTIKITREDAPIELTFDIEDYLENAKKYTKEDDVWLQQYKVAARLRHSSRPGATHTRWVDNADTSQ